MSILSSHAVSVALPLVGTALEAELRGFMRAQHYSAVSIDETIAYLEANGTAAGCPSIDADDQAEADLIIRGRTGSTEYASAADWPRAWDSDVWSLTDTEPALEPLPPVRPFEPSPEDRSWWAMTRDAEQRIDHALDGLEAEARSLELLTRGLTPFAPVSGGSPDPRPVSPELAKVNADYARLRAGFPAIAGGAPTPDEKPVKVRGRHEKGQPNLTDSDILLHTGCVG